MWDACTGPERINRWLLPVTGDLRAGGTFRLEGNARESGQAWMALVAAAGARPSP